MEVFVVFLMFYMFGQDCQEALEQQPNQIIIVMEK